MTEMKPQPLVFNVTLYFEPKSLISNEASLNFILSRGWYPSIRDVDTDSNWTFPLSHWPLLLECDFKTEPFVKGVVLCLTLCARQCSSLFIIVKYRHHPNSGMLLLSSSFYSQGKQRKGRCNNLYPMWLIRAALGLNPKSVWFPIHGHFCGTCCLTDVPF